MECDTLDLVISTRRDTMHQIELLLIICILHVRIYLSSKLNSDFKCNYAGTYAVYCGMFSSDISLVLRDCDMDSENISLIQLLYQMARKHAV